MSIDPDTSFQLWTIILVSLNFLIMFLTLKSGAGFSPFASAFGAYIFAFANVRVVQVGHPQLLPQFFSILVVFALLKIFPLNQGYPNFAQVNKTYWICLFFLGVVLQLYASWYLGWFLVFGLTVCFFTSLFFQTSRRQLQSIMLHHWKVTLVAAIVAAALLSWMGFHYFEALQLVSGRKWEDMDWTVPRVQSWFFMGYSNVVYGWTSDWILSNFRLTQIQEHQLGLGLVSLVCALLGLRKFWSTVWGKIVIISTLFIFLSSLNFLGYLSGWRIIQIVFPGATSIRAVCRISLLLLIVFSFGIATFLDQLKNKGLVAILAIVMCLEQVAVTPSYDKEEYRERVDKIVELIPKDSHAFYYANLLSKNEIGTPYGCQLDAMWAQIRVNKPTLNGYSGNEPPGWPLSECLINPSSAMNRLKQNLFEWCEKNYISER